MKCTLTVLFIFLFSSFNYSQNPTGQIEKHQFPAGTHSCLSQLQRYPLPRYLPGNKLARNFNWMNPNYLGGSGQTGTTIPMVIHNAIQIQEELILHWNYGVVIPHAALVFQGNKDTVCPPVIQLANAYPNVPLHVISFWLGIRPNSIGYPYENCTLVNKNLDPSLYIDFDFYGKKTREIKFNFPDSLIRIDGEVQKYNISRIVKCLKRPIDLINENGEEPPGPYLLSALKKDQSMIRMKDSLGIPSWVDFMAVRKLAMRNAYSSVFMKGIPELKKTFFSIYTVEGGPVDRFKWSVMKKCMTPRNGCYYATPDFYARWPSNWKDWKGPWHGWSWIESGRKVEIKDGDYLFSPFVAAGWSNKSSEDIRPGQWLGLLKCLSVTGAEFYYVCYFTLGFPFTPSTEWTWQAAMPAYAQAITSRFEDVLRDGNVLFDSSGEPIISYPIADRHVLITARKHNKKEKYVICGTYQPFTNDSGEIPAKKIVSVKIDSQIFTFEVRRQGSVYIYEKFSGGKTVFYQLDRWHENAHPDYWSSDFCFEAETPDSGLEDANLSTNTKGAAGDYSSFTTSVKLIAAPLVYHFVNRDSSMHPCFVWLRYKGKGNISVGLKSEKMKTLKLDIQLPPASNWQWHKISLPINCLARGENALEISSSEGSPELDRFVISGKETFKEPKD